ncbi:hypothetical protein, partial [Bacillus cereus]|uniref:hypothetical protein n=1 Tax=Bacillus cereus TaxID=1396 RepID=UPI001C54F3F2
PKSLFSLAFLLTLTFQIPRYYLFLFSIIPIHNYLGIAPFPPVKKIYFDQIFKLKKEVIVIKITIIHTT